MLFRGDGLPLKPRADCAADDCDHLPEQWASGVTTLLCQCCQRRARMNGEGADRGRVYESFVYIGDRMIPATVTVSRHGPCSGDRVTTWLGRRKNEKNRPTP